MASWKTWNEVPDSDEEEEDPDSQEGQIDNAAVDEPILRQHAPTDESEDELGLPGPPIRLLKKSSPQSSGLRTKPSPNGTQVTAAVETYGQNSHTETADSKDVFVVEDVLSHPSADSPSREQVTNPAIASSPLTELSSSPPDAWATTNITDKPAEKTVVGAEGTQEGALVSDGEKRISAEPQRRSKRKRNAIQLNPYRIENQMYRQSIQRAGIAPVRIQDKYDSEDDGNDEYYPGQTRDTQDIGQPDNLNGDSLNFNISFGDDEPPDLESLLEAQARTRDNGGSTHKAANFNSRKRKRSFVRAGTSIRNEAATVDDRTAKAQSIFDIPSPPPSSQSPTEKRRSPKVFRYPPGIAPPQLKTPAVSSEVCSYDLGNPTRIVSDDHPNSPSDAEDDSRQSPSRKALYGGAVSQDTPESEESNDEADVRSVRRRIKGVLPASWLRFDRKKQVERSEQTPLKLRTNASPQRFHKGVARPLLKRRGSTTQQTSMALIVSDDSDAESVLPKHDLPTSILSPSQTRAVTGEVVDVSSDSMEDNHIDQMLPPQPRKRRQKGRFRMFQAAQSSASATIKSQRQTKIYEHIQDREHENTHRRTPRRDLSLSILDIQHTSRTPALPNFLRVALRTTKSRRDRGIQLPHSKLVQLEPAGRTDDAEDTLSQWRAQNMDVFRTEVRQQRPSRPPLRPLSGNARSKRYLSQSKRTNRSLKSSTVSGDFWSNQDTLEKRLSRQGNHSTVSIDHRTETPKSTSIIRKNGHVHAISSTVAHLGQVLPGQLEDVALSSSMRSSADHTSRFPVQRSRSGVVDKTPILDRYFDPPTVDHQPVLPHEARLADVDKLRPQSRRLVRKRCPQQKTISLSTVPAWYQTCSTPNSETEAQNESDDRFRNCGLEDLGTYGHDYTWDFDIDPLPRGSLVGNHGMLERVYLQCLANGATIQNGIVAPGERKILRETTEALWGPWNEQVATEIDKYLQVLRECISETDSATAVQQRAIKGIYLINMYLAGSIHFLDPIDRPACIERLVGLLQDVLETMALRFNDKANETISSHANESTLQSLSAEIVVFSYQLVVLSHNDAVGIDLKKRTSATCERLLQITVQGIFRNGMSDLYQYQQALNNCSGHWATDQCRVKADTLVIANHISRLFDTSSGIWKYLQMTEPFSLHSGLRSVVTLERKWFNLFAILPFLEVGIDGYVPQGQSKRFSAAAWSYVLKLLHPVMRVYEQEQSQQASMLNEYYRALLGRCLVLINKWGWTDCEVILRALYDSFARNNLHNLPWEEGVGYPQFLTNFKPSSLVQDRSDKAFHIFVKILGAGMLRMSEQFTEKKMRSIAFRLTPNHSRSLPKEESLRQEDLDALRNHHNLLCLLYIVLPAGCRPRPRLIQDLIRVEDSHRRACHINVRTWTDLTLFQLSTQEPVTALEPLIVWYDDLLTQLIRQHALARKEVEAHEDILSAELRETMIASNQRQVEAVLCDALHSLQLCIQHSRAIDNANVLLTKAFGTVFALFNPKVSRTNSVLVEALAVVNSFLRHGETLLSNTESQDFGDWSAFEECIPSLVDTSIIVPEWLIEAVHALLSSCLGSTDTVDDPFSTLVVTTWASMACYLVKSGAREWNDFVDLYGRNSWYSFLLTDRTAKFTPLFLALIVEKDPSVYEKHQSTILKSWVDTLVERESLLKYQARLTSAILNLDAENPLLENPPFWRNKASDAFEISTSDLALRRQALISSFLSNMAEAVLFSTYHNLPEAQTRRYEYADILKTMMKAMKEKYTALGTGIEVRGAYVEFVQEVAGLLQQHTNHIHPLDRFFLDAKNFPLPVHDPGYVVSRLKSYQLKLAESHGPKQLVAFVQTIAERAVVDGSQDYLIDQLRTALCNVFEDGNVSRPTLRAFTLKSVLPAYVDAAMDMKCGWLIASPLLEALRDVVGHILEDLDAANPASVGAVLLTLGTLLQRLYVSLHRLVSRPETLTRPATARLLALVYSLVTATLRPMDFCIRIQQQHEPGSGKALVSCISSLLSIASLALAPMLARQTRAILPPPPMEGMSVDDPALAYAASGVRAALAKWTAKGDDTYEVRGAGGMVRAVKPNLSSFEAERGAFRGELMRFERAVSSLPGFATLVEG